MDIQSNQLLPATGRAGAAPSAGGEVAGGREAGWRAGEAAAAGWGWMPALSLVAACGLLLVSTAYTGGRNSRPHAELFFWGGLLALYAPIALRLAMPGVARRERIGLALLLGLGLYLVKVLHSPLLLTHHDEFMHWRTANDIVASGRLFRENPLLPVSALFPGLESVTAALVSLSGLPIFYATLILVGAARLVLTLALFLLYEQAGGSARVAGMATALYMANPNYLFFIAMFKYESLALPFAVLVLFLVARRERARPPARPGLTLAALLALGLVVTTHHISAYALSGFLLLWAALDLPRRRVAEYLISQPNIGSENVPHSTLSRPAGRIEGCGPLPPAPFDTRSALLRVLDSWPFQQAQGIASRPSWTTKAEFVTEAPGPGGIALLSVVASLVWLLYVAGVTVGYLAGPLRGALAGLIGMIAREPEAARELFRSSAGQIAPLWERLAAFGAVGLIMLALPFGLRQIWRRRRRRALALALAAGVLLYPFSLAFRLTRRGWEASNRSSELLFVAIGFVVALAAAAVLLPGRRPRLRALLFATLAALIFMGGLIAGWPSAWRLPGPYLPQADSRSVEPQGLAAAGWARAYLGPGNRLGADRMNTLLMGSYGEQRIMKTLSGGENVLWVLFAPEVGPQQLDLLRRGQVRYLLVDRRLIAAPQVARAYYPHTPIRVALEKFDRVRRINRVFDSGDIIIYDVGRLGDVP